MPYKWKCEVETWNIHLFIHKHLLSPFYVLGRGESALFFSLRCSLLTLCCERGDFDTILPILPSSPTSPHIPKELYNFCQISFSVFHYYAMWELLAADPPGVFWLPFCLSVSQGQRSRARRELTWDPGGQGSCPVSPIASWGAVGNSRYLPVPQLHDSTCFTGILWGSSELLCPKCLEQGLENSECYVRVCYSHHYHLQSKGGNIFLNLVSLFYMLTWLIVWLCV